MSGFRSPRELQITALLEEDPEAFYTLIGEAERLSDPKLNYSRGSTRSNKQKLASVLKSYNEEIEDVLGLSDPSDLALAIEIIDAARTAQVYQEHVDQDGGYSS